MQPFQAAQQAAAQQEYFKQIAEQNMQQNIQNMMIPSAMAFGNAHLQVQYSQIL